LGINSEIWTPLALVDLGFCSAFLVLLEFRSLRREAVHEAQGWHGDGSRAGGMFHEVPTIRDSEHDKAHW
jgi:hypothetical protein